jgi:PTH1 family peptidyl-tRNA hydrolase
MYCHSEREEHIAAVVGLGNPGKKYEATRHNLGFRVLESLAGSLGAVLQDRKFRASWCQCELRGRKVLLIKPLTYMNRSGEAVAEVLRYFGIPGSQVLVVHDDLDLPPGRMRLARRGGPGGHRGVASIISQLGSQSFARLKLGIGRPLHGESVEDYVLQIAYPEQRPIFHEMILRGAKAAETVLLSGLDGAMNQFNRPELVETVE